MLFGQSPLSPAGDWALIANTAGAVVVVVLFLRHLREDRKAREITERQRLEVLEHLGSECHEHSTRMLDAVSNVVRASNEVCLKDS